MLRNLNENKRSFLESMTAVESKSKLVNVNCSNKFIFREPLKLARAQRYLTVKIDKYNTKQRGELGLVFGIVGIYPHIFDIFGSARISGLPNGQKDLN